MNSSDIESVLTHTHTQSLHYIMLHSKALHAWLHEHTWQHDDTQRFIVQHAVQCHRHEYLICKRRSMTLTQNVHVASIQPLANQCVFDVNKANATNVFVTARFRCSTSQSTTQPRLSVLALLLLNCCCAINHTVQPFRVDLTV